MYRDDKSYPYVRFSAHRYPRISYYRGAKTGNDRYFGPFPSAVAVRETLSTLQKLFLLRPCRDSFFAHRDRPCLQHQIKRSEEHTSELQSLMRISYAVFCLKKKNNNTLNTNN